MTRAAPLWAALAALALTACPRPQQGAGPAAAPQMSTEEKIADQESRLAGSYQCRIEVRDEVFEGPCAIRPAGDAFTLQMQGERALTGQVTATDSGFRLEGELSCTGADCTADPVSTDFFEQNQAEYRGVFALVSQGAIANAALIRQ